MSSARAIIKVSVIEKKNNLNINYSRRMYAILRRYTPDAFQGSVNECYAELTGLRTFFKMTYQEMMEKIAHDLLTEIGVICKVQIATISDYELAKKSAKKPKSISTYKEINSLFVGASFIPKKERSRNVKHLSLKRRVRLTVPFLGKVS
ncbi:MAG: hypothetical protein RLZZ308_454 [Candidatus Parcubacteria bacterium]|jgi:nucleotidyltransferase/DNA polymerase involved in DNA repair